MKTRETLFFDEWGWREVRLTYEVQEIDMMGIKQNITSHKLAIMDAQNLATVDLDKMTGGLMVNPHYENLSKLTEEEQQQFGEKVIDGMNAKVKDNGTETVANKNCKVTTATIYMENGEVMSNSRLSQWKNILLKSQTDAMGSYIEEQAFQVTEMVVPESIFRLPSKAVVRKVKMPGEYMKY